MKYLFLALILSGCSHLGIKDSLTSGSCYVHWERPQDKEKLKAGLGKTRSERSELRLTIPMGKNPMFYIKEVKDGMAIVSPWQGGVSDPEHFDEFKQSLSQYLSTEDEEEKIKELYFWSNKKFKTSWLESYINKGGWEKVNCSEIDNSLFM